MPKLLYAPTSPYSAKVRLSAVYAGLEFDPVIVDMSSEPAELMDANPLGKIPVWITDDGQAIFDSRAITQYLNRISGSKIFPRNPDKRTQAEHLEALADGICDAALAHVYERRSRPEDKHHQPWLNKQWRKVERGLDALNADTPKFGKINAGHFALRATLAYLNLRFNGQWEKGRSKLVRWAARFDQKFPELKALLPS